jgi:SulP family sulfate permease
MLSVGLILGLRRWRPKWPTLLITIAIAAALTAAFSLDVATIGSRFGGVPRSLPGPSLPEISLARMQALLPDALAIALLGSIESLLSAVVADGMTGRRHRSNCELVAQGVGNIAAVTFGGMCVTGTIARTATNVRSGARGPVAGMLPLRRRLRATFRSRAWALCSPSSPGTWRRSTSSAACCARGAATRRCCSRPSC